MNITYNPKLSLNLNARNFFTFIVILTPFFMQYTSYLPGVTLGDILLAVSSIYLLITNNLVFITKKTLPLIVFWIVGTFVTLTSILVQQEITFEIITRYIRYSFYLFVILVSAKYLNFKFALNTYRILCILISLYIIFQVLIYNLLGIVSPFKILPLAWAGGYEFNVDDVSTIASMFYYRPSGIFVEPGYAAQYLFPGLVFSLFGWLKSKNIDIKSTLLILFALMLSTSSQGVFIGGIIIGFYIVMLLWKKRKTFSNILSIILFIVISLLFLNLDSVQIAIDKVTNESREGSSEALRLYRGYAVYNELPIAYKIIGVGHGNVGHFVTEKGIITKYDPQIMTEAIADYTNGVSAALLYYGIFGLITLLFLYFDFIRNTIGAFRLIVITQIILTLVEGALFGASIIFYFSFIYAGYIISKNYTSKGEF